MLRSVLSFLACIVAAMASATAAAQTIRFAATSAYPGELVTVDIWYEAGGDVVAFDFVGRYDPSLQIVAFRPGDHSSSSCNVLPSDNELRMVGFDVMLAPLRDHRICTIDLRVAHDATPGWHGLIFGAAEPSTKFFDADMIQIPGHLHGGGVFVIKRPGTCSFVRQDMPSLNFVPAFAPVCQCLRSAEHPLHRCGIRFGEDFVLWREFPPMPDPREWNKAHWTLVPLREDLPGIDVHMKSQSGQVWADAVHFDKNSTPLKSTTITTGFKVDGPKALDRLEVHIEFGGQTYQFEQRLRDPKQD